MKMLRVTITAEADRKVRKLAREFRTTPVVVLGLFLKFELARLKQQDSE